MSQANSRYSLLRLCECEWLWYVRHIHYADGMTRKRPAVCAWTPDRMKVSVSAAAFIALPRLTAVYNQALEAELSHDNYEVAMVERIATDDLYWEDRRYKYAELFFYVRLFQAGANPLLRRTTHSPPPLHTPFSFHRLHLNLASPFPPSLPPGRPQQRPPPLTLTTLPRSQRLSNCRSAAAPTLMCTVIGATKWATTIDFAGPSCPEMLRGRHMLRPVEGCRWRAACADNGEHAHRGGRRGRVGSF